MLVDTIESGDNTSGNLYTATSSYKSVNIARLTDSEIANATIGTDTETTNVNTSSTTSDTYRVGSTTFTPTAPSSSSSSSSSY